MEQEYFDKFDEIIDKYLPGRGEGDTLASQAVAAVNKLIYKWFNGGNLYDNTYHLPGGTNDLSAYANWLLKNVPEVKSILNSIKKVKSEEAYSDLLAALADTILNENFLSKFEDVEKVGSVYECEGPFEFDYGREFRELGIEEDYNTSGSRITKTLYGKKFIFDLIPGSDLKEGMIIHNLNKGFMEPIFFEILKIYDDNKSDNRFIVSYREVIVGKATGTYVISRDKMHEVLFKIDKPNKVEGLDKSSDRCAEEIKEKWKPSKTAKKEFAQKMDEIDKFCKENGITKSSNSDSYYFNIDGQDYRVSNHTVAASNKGAYDKYGNTIRDKYHPFGELEDTIYITASKTRLIDIYNDLKNGYKLDRRGNRIIESFKDSAEYEYNGIQIFAIPLNNGLISVTGQWKKGGGKFGKAQPDEKIYRTTNKNLAIKTYIDKYLKNFLDKNLKDIDKNPDAYWD